MEMGVLLACYFGKGKRSERGHYLMILIRKIRVIMIIMMVIILLVMPIMILLMVFLLVKVTMK